MDRAIVLRSFVIAVVLSLAAYNFFGKQAALAVVVGALIAAANFRLASGMLRKIVVPGVNPATGNMKGLFFFLIRYAIVGISLVAAIRAGIKPVFLIIGVSTLVVAVLSSTFGLVKSAGEA